MTRALRTLVVDDSAYNRRVISDLLSAMEGVEVVGKAADGDEALRLVESLLPDLITLDLEMPRVDGFSFLRLLMARRPTPVIVVSGYSAKENVFRALELGALDFVAKPTTSATTDLSQIRDELAEKVGLVRHLSPARLDPKARGSLGGGRTATQVFLTPRGGPVEASAEPPSRLVVVGASTGGPTALLEVFSRFPGRVGGSIVVAQHMPERFTRTFAERLDRLGALKVREAGESERLSSGEGWVCPGGRCIDVLRAGSGLSLRTAPPSVEDRYVPSADRLFESAARAFGPRVIAVVLTGMGDDGARGVTAVKNAGGMVLAESADTAVIYGMPGAAVRTGAVDRSLPLRDLADHVAELVVAG